jgi:hypothetical protein
MRRIRTTSENATVAQNHPAPVVPAEQTPTAPVKPAAAEEPARPTRQSAVENVLDILGNAIRNAVEPR